MKLQPDVNLMPLDVGFDLRAVGMKINLPAGDVLTIRYPDEDGNPVEVTSRRPEIVFILRREGYLLPDELEEPLFGETS